MSAPRTYPVAELLTDFSTQPLSTILLLRDALAYGLRTHRVGRLDFTAEDQRGQAMAFSRTGCVLNSRPASALTRDKQTTRLLLQKSGSPVPRGRRFNIEEAEAGIAYALELGYPVVVKPLTGTEGKGVTTNIQDADELRWAFRDLESYGSTQDVIVEEHVEGEAYRAIVIDGVVESMLISRRGAIQGDGESTVRRLIEQRQHARMLNPHLMGRPIQINSRMEHLLARQGTGLDEVLPSGEAAFFTFGSNTHQGGEPAQVLDRVHPTIVAACSKAARAIPGLGFAGIDFIISDITAPLDKQKAAICEINSVPAADVHEYPLFGSPVSVTHALVAASARRSGLSLNSPYSRFVSTHMRVTGRIGAEYAAWIAERAVRMELCGGVRVTSRRSAEIHASGDVELVAILESLAFKGPRGTAIRTIVTEHSTDRHTTPFSALT